MTLQEFKTTLKTQEEIRFELPTGLEVPSHFHITELGLMTRSTIGCGGSLLEEKNAIIQLWYSNDIHHRLSPEKVISILDKGRKLIPQDDIDLQIEYQNESIARYALKFENGRFIMQALKTDCPDPDICGVPEEKEKKELASLGQSSCCSGTSCC